MTWTRLALSNDHARATPGTTRSARWTAPHATGEFVTARKERSPGRDSDVAGIVPLDDVADMVTEAGMLHQRSQYETSLTGLGVRHGDPLGDLETAFELAAALGIPEDRLREVVATRFPPAADQLAALEQHHAIATTRAVAQTYRHQLLTVLRRAMPSREFVGQIEKAVRFYDEARAPVAWRREYVVRLGVVRERRARASRRPWWKRFGGYSRVSPDRVVRDRVPIATVEVGNECHLDVRPVRGRAGAGPRWRSGHRLYLVVTVGSGVFIKVCEGTLLALRARFERHNGLAGHDVRYDYVVDEAHQLG